MKKVNNFVAKHNHNRASVHKDRSKEIPRNDKFQEDWLEYLDEGMYERHEEYFNDIQGEVKL